MDRLEIQQRASELETTIDLVQLLNEIKEDALGEKAHSFQLKQITYYCNPCRKSVRRYINFTIPKKNGGERVISAPVRGLKSILFSLNTMLQALYEPSPYAMGFAPGRSVVDNAKKHIGQRYIYNIDLKDFFPSIDKSRVWKRLTLPPFNFDSKIADVIAGLCTMHIEENGKDRFVLPQGAPTSPILTNAICDTLDRRLAAVARRFGLRYSRYADDITFSSMHYVYSENGAFISALKEVVASQNFIINEKKSRLQILGKRQEVTGIIVSDKINVSRKYAREIKTLLHIWDKFGYLAACKSFTKARSSDAVQQKNISSPKLEAVIAGKLQYMKMVKGANDAVYQTLQAKFDNLLSKMKKIEFSSDGQEITYHAMLTRKEFEDLMDAQIIIDAGNKTVSFEQNNRKQSIAISKNITEERLSQLAASDNDSVVWKDYRISLCSNRNVQFYMLHKCFNKKKQSYDNVRLTDIDNIFTYRKLSPMKHSVIANKKDSSNILKRIGRCVKRFLIG